MTVQHLQPEGLHRNPAFSQAIVVEGSHRTVYVGGQNAVDADGNVVGVGDLGAQTEQVCRNVQTALTAAGARLDHLIQLTICVVQGQPIREAFVVSQRVWGSWAKPPTLSVLVVAGLAHPDFLIEIEAVAVVPD